MARLIVVDASLAVKWLLPEEFSTEARALFSQWASQQVRMVGVHLLPMEVANTLHRRSVSAGDATRLMANFLRYGVELICDPAFHARAIELASELRQGAVYDAHYLALAESLGCEMWTADRRFHRIAADASYPVHWVGDYVAN